MSTYHASRNSKASDLPETVNFVRQRPYASFRPVDFIPYAPLYEESERKIDDWLNRLFEGEIDDANGDVLDSLITDTLRLALHSLADQHVTHVDRVRDLSVQFSAGRLHYEEHEKDAGELLERLTADYEEADARVRAKKWRNER
ncbi:MAG: hypothetical protein IJU99_04900 [Lachnospiraceae bacterium]|nr:hypothetical protein [Lachnospiraceae bacterium]